MIQLPISQNSVQVNYPTAFEAMPEPYQNDSVLDFYFEDGYLHCTPKESEKEFCGDWNAFFDPDLKTWCDSETNEPIN